MDVYKTHGAFSWSELATPDPEAAAVFYAALFGWQVQPAMPGLGDYRLASIGSEMVAGIMLPPPDALPMPPHWGVYITVTHCDKAVEKAVALGGRLLVQPMDVPTVGRMAVLQDPQGAVFSVMQYSEG
jgi:predicted enzyme related to lactoylglutathione lyase